MTDQPVKWDVHQEFSIVDHLLASKSRSKGVDAFALSLLKGERHARRVFTFLVFQNSCFAENDSAELRSILARNDRFSFTSALAGIDLISPCSLAEICGDLHKSLLSSLPSITNRRNKIFHGQLTQESLSTEELTVMALILKNWSISLAENGANKLGYDGFSLESFVKNPDPEFRCSLKRQLTSLADYSALIMEAIPAGRLLVRT